MLLYLTWEVSQYLGRKFRWRFSCCFARKSAFAKKQMARLRGLQMSSPALAALPVIEGRLTKRLSRKWMPEAMKAASVKKQLVRLRGLQLSSQALATKNGEKWRRTERPAAEQSGRDTTAVSKVISKVRNAASYFHHSSLGLLVLHVKAVSTEARAQSPKADNWCSKSLE